ncbi:MAG: substrate-binding domain-containing protein [Pseudomonadota bacterium]|nr:substrate-binding domain-containing protein [Pseudomonadota bacterium]
MFVRLARLLSFALIGVCLISPAALARTHAKKHAASKGPTLIWRGDVATANGVVNEVAQAWEATGHGHIELQPFNTASGIDGVAGGTADIAGAARPADDSLQNSRLTFTPVAWDALVIIANASNPVHGLTLKQVHDIYYGKIHNWSEVGGSDAPINVYAVASPGDGVEYSLRSLLFGRGNQPVAAPRLYVNMRKLEEGVSLNPNGLGVATLTSISGNSKLKAIPINGKPATVANVADGSYPLFTTLYLVTNPTSPKAAAVQAFLDFMQTEPAKAAMHKHAVLPYSDSPALVALDASRRAGILAEVGARPRHVGTPISAPGATYAARVAVAPTSPDTIAAKRALANRQEEAKETARINKVAGSVANVTVSSVANATASATTVSEPASGSTFGQVTADAVQGSATRAGGSYKVVKGDTLSSIARRRAVKVSQLREWNHISGNTIQLGQSLRVNR